ncbi:complement C1q-like protein 2 isoform X3 [Scomber japonicus]|uniref:complement C1q-like protein 2 isoform X3 n=1 Tax=Scomber japonicus TaxID=13676 RepID=UPI002306CE80|nr:complement C1q-like protein 2 isoform X3 [Scomber japonicus]
MRRAAAFLVLLLCLYWTRAQGESGGVTGNDITQTEVQSDILGVIATSDQTNITPDIWAELKELRDMAIKHSVELSNSKSKMEKLEQENTAIQARLTASENEMVKLKIENADLQSRVTASEDKSTVLEARMNTSEKEVEELKRQNADQPKVAFSLGLTNSGQVGPFNTDITLKFSKVFAHLGQAYSPTTGLFTAPVRGVYYFSFNIMDQRKNVWTGVYLYHNDKRLLLNDDYNDEHANNRISNSLALQLEKGDLVYMVLPAHRSVFDDANDHTTFNGFLLFPL